MNIIYNPNKKPTQLEEDIFKSWDLRNRTIESLLGYKPKHENEKISHGEDDPRKIRLRKSEDAKIIQLGLDGNWQDLDDFLFNPKTRYAWMQAFMEQDKNKIFYKGTQSSYK